MARIAATATAAAPRHGRSALALRRNSSAAPNPSSSA